MLKRVLGNKGRAEMTLAELEAALAWLERNRLADYLHLLDGDARYAWDGSSARGVAGAPRPGRAGGSQGLGLLSLSLRATPIGPALWGAAASRDLVAGSILARLRALALPFRTLDGSTPSERQAQEDELMRSGEALASDIFLVTGVPRSPPEFGNWNEPNG